MHATTMLLPGLNVNPHLITAAGYSLGAYEAHYLHVANSELFKGVGILNGSIYGKSFDDRIKYGLD